MKKFTIIPVLFTLILSGCTSKLDRQIDDLVSQMTLEEKALLVVGVGNESRWHNDVPRLDLNSILPAVAGGTTPIDRLGIPYILLSDGPAGVNLESYRKGDSTRTYYCTQFPIGTLLASTWNTELVQTVGSAIGDEALAYGVDVLLGPGMNIHRHPLNGRNFEYYSEDPLLCGLTAAAYVNGIQSHGVAACPKHFAANNQETNRMGNDARVSERALREIYYRGFEFMVKESHPRTLMTSYNKINGISVSERRDAVTDMLRDEWGFDGVVMSDWYGGDHPTAQIHAGNDMLQPGRQWQIDSIINGVKNGTLEERDLDISVRRILKLIYTSPRTIEHPTNDAHLDEHAQITRESATEGMVLLKNDANALPLTNSTKNIALFGCASYDFIPGGTGSGDVYRAYTVSMLEGLQNAGYTIDASMAAVYGAFIQKSVETNKAAAPGRYAELTRIRPDEMPLTPQQIDAQVQRADVAIVTLGRTSGEYYDRPSADYDLSAAERAMLEQVCGAFHAAGKKVIVVLNIGGVIETASWKHLPDAILCAWQPGQEGGNSVADILSGKANPSGRLPMTFPIRLSDVGASANFPIDQTSENVSVALRRKDVGEKNVDFTNYDEGIYVGYRWFDTRSMEVSFPFGYGLSYTTFEYSDAKVKQRKDKIMVTVTITNSGKVAGKEVVQLYAAAPKGQLDKPTKELRAYAKTSIIQPGKSETITLTFDCNDLSSYDEQQHKWILAPGTYQLLIAASSRDIRQTLTLDI